jgi:hypothetical protein
VVSGPEMGNGIYYPLGSTLAVMKRLAIVGFVGMVLLAGCAATHDGDFYKVVRVIPVFQASTDAELQSLGHNTCQIFKSASALKGLNGWDLATSSSEEGGLTTDQAALLVVAAVSTYCPEYRKEVPPDYLQ